jgi:hypothetical protein
MKYFPLLYRLNDEERYLIWISNEQDAVAVDHEGFVPSFRDLVNLRRYADLNQYRLDLDWVAKLKMAMNPQIDCETALAAWNLFSDVAVSTPSHGNAFQTLDSKAHWPIYDKLFRGNNLLAVTPEGERYIPEWSQDEVRSLAKLLTAGLDLFVSSIRTWPRELSETSSAPNTSLT